MTAWIRVTDAAFEEWTREYTLRESGYAFRNSEGIEPAWGWALLLFKEQRGEHLLVERILASGGADSLETSRRMCDAAWEGRVP